MKAWAQGVAAGPRVMSYKFVYEGDRLAGPMLQAALLSDGQTIVASPIDMVAETESAQATAIHT
jgi:hypothetical protein